MDETDKDTEKLNDEEIKVVDTISEKHMNEIKKEANGKA